MKLNGKIVILIFTLVFIVSCGAKMTKSNEFTKVINDEEVENMNVETEKPKKPKKDKKELKKLIKVVIDLPQLQNYYHVDQVKERKPLNILKNENIKKNYNLTKFDLPVNFLTCDELKKGNLPYFEFTNIEIDQDKANVVFRYRVEGIEGSLDLSKKDSDWFVESQKIVETKFSEKGCVRD